MESLGDYSSVVSKAYSFGVKHEHTLSGLNFFAWKEKTYLGDRSEAYQIPEQKEKKFAC